MRHGTLLLWLALPILGSGCGFAQNVRRNVVFSPLYTFTDRADKARHHHMGREAFVQMAQQYSDQEFSCDYRKGFVDGFADYLNFGGVGEPPPIPPPIYRLFGYMTPDGLAAMEEWRLGFRHGSATAKASGLRELVTLPVYWGPVYVSDPRLPSTKLADALRPPDLTDTLPQPTKLEAPAVPAGNDQAAPNKPPGEPATVPNQKPE